MAHVASLPYQYGEGIAPLFSPDESKLALARATNVGLDVYLDIDEYEVPLDDHGRTTREAVLVWAVLRVQELPDGAVSICELLVRVPTGFPTEGNDSYYPSGLSWQGSEALVLRTKWGAHVEIPLPLPESLILSGPTKRGPEGADAS